MRILAIPALLGRLVLSAGLVVSANAVAHDTNIAGSTSCDRSSPGECKIAWTLPAEGPPFVFIERLDKDAVIWIRMHGPLSERSGAMQIPAPEGQVYRAIACESVTQGADCTSASAVWAPFHFTSVDQIPATVTSRQGTVFTVSKIGNDGLEGQRQQFNAYKAVDLCERITDADAWSTVPPMTTVLDPLQMPDQDPEWLYDDLIQFVVSTGFVPIDNAPAQHDPE